ncbi:MAG TPA: hypothetical protein VM187_01575 [Niastella sp.]|nr:hypothetical protein [Niastella sp.]
MDYWLAAIINTKICPGKLSHGKAVIWEHYITCLVIVADPIQKAYPGFSRTMMVILSLIFFHFNMKAHSQFAIGDRHTDTVDLVKGINQGTTIGRIEEQRIQPVKAWLLLQGSFMNGLF